MTTTVRLSDHQCDLRDYRVDITGKHMSLTIMATDGTSLMIDDVAAVENLHDACGRYLDEYRRRDAADEEYARQLDAFLIRNGMLSPGGAPNG